MKGPLFLLAVIAICAPLSIAWAQDGESSSMSCEQITSRQNELNEQYKSQRKHKKKAFENWDKYYKQLHSIEYGGTERPLADTAKQCKEGGGPDELFCKEALKRFDEISGKEAQAKQELDSAEQDLAETGSELDKLNGLSENKGC